MTVNLLATALFALGWILRREHLTDARGTAAGSLTLSVVALILVGVGGFLGGELAYRYGVRVADETTQATGYRHLQEQESPTAAPPPPPSR